MGRPLTLRPEIIGSAHQALAEMPRPNTIDQHTRSKRILLRYQPSGEDSSPLTRRGGSRIEEVFVDRENCRQSWGHQLEGLAQLTAFETVNLQWRLAMKQTHARLLIGLDGTTWVLEQLLWDGNISEDSIEAFDPMLPDRIGIRTITGGKNRLD